MSASYSFSKEDTTYRFLHKDLIIRWLTKSIRSEKHNPGEISFIFCSDKYLLKMNREHLNHDYYTDIITFDYCENKTVSGDIFISIDRVKDNAKKYGVTIKHELYRVMIHGILHLCGYGDKSAAKARIMRQKEDYYLSLHPLLK
ncbi:MAG TPA: rRNA maturation RNase YbeY [Flavobacteriales bacterium]|nr:rRNA maturation RNase YbeY [Flavobacteriales bacterium]